MTGKAMTLRVSSDQHDALKLIATEQEGSISDVVRVAVDRHIASFLHHYAPTGSNGMRYCDKCGVTEADPNGLCMWDEKSGTVDGK